MEIVKKHLSDLKLSEYNPRKHSEEFLAKLDKSIAEFGFIEPIIWNKRTGNVVGGHARVKVLLKRGLKSTEVSVVNLSPEKEKALNICLNKVSGEWDEEKLAELLREMGEEEFLLTGFSDKEFNQLLADLEQVPEPIQEDPLKDVPERCKTGDLWQLGEHRLLCGDATKKEDVDMLMGGKKADLVFTDPPYGVSYSEKNRFLNTMAKGNFIQKPIVNDNVDMATIKKLWLESFKNIRASLADDGSYYITGPQGGDLHMMMMMMMIEAGLPLRHVLIWVKNNHVLGRTDYNYKHEPLLFGWIKTHKFYGSGPYIFSVWDIDKPHESKLVSTMKPIELMENAILNSTLPEQSVLDVFGGSGSTLIACERTGRKCYMLEIESRNCDVILMRWENLTKKEAKKL